MIKMRIYRMRYDMRQSVLIFCLGILMGTALESGVKRNPKMTYLENEAIRFGADLSIGGAITHLSTKKGPNMVNSHDWGRQIQMSFYSGPQPFEPNGKKPSDHWKQLGWNPIQSGDYGGNPSKILEHKNDGKEIYIKCIPMHWPLKNQPGQCIFECWYSIKGNVVSVRSKLTNQRDDKKQYRARNQEVPALYSNGSWYRIVTYTGNRPYTQDKTIEISRKPERPPFPWNRFHATEEWAALVDVNDQGFGVWTPGAQEYLGGFAGRPGKGGPKDSPTCYVSPLQTEIIDHNIEYTYEYQLIVGSVDTIRNHVYKERSQKNAFEFTFNKDRQHWSYSNATDTGFPVRNRLDIVLDKNHPRLNSPLLCLEASSIKTISLRAAFTTDEKQAQLAWSQHGSKIIEKGDVINFPIKSDGKMRTYNIPVSESDTWKGTISKIYLKPCKKGGKNKRLRVESIKGK